MSKKAIVVGATSGIGRGIAELLVSKGYIVGITGRREHLLNEIKASSPSSYIVSTFDINNTQNVLEKLEDLATQLGGVDLFILSSGVGKRNKDLDLEPELDTIMTNVTGFTTAVNWAYKYFENAGGGKLASISSIAGTRGFGLSPSYSASKSYQIKYLEALRQKAKTTGGKISVTDVRPGFVDTAMGNGDGAFWIAPVEKASKQIVRAIDNKRGVVFVTKRWRIVSILLRLIPRSIFERLKF
ncbi:MAG: oxidoreductase [Bacteroidetes bacterium GWE2_39_28]|nr:MAG: oxidoreductase [Bacteroidetes bacterium GWE2_39_28]OFY15280.1 MAG: oxidoreductase [Bacteroidetes bacterium GWF2_39_10]OFZ07105.1 MAG: oxidoreductase [Bacteroidetes bacterium RIFOXYB2_FULL_39_7]OFZ11128.1 MAG: oxidoreductase [Bacteroidetes bacterium RIFOXYC2_FULL_39_11]HCT93914.1 oxidoreductase [Rikenellaceae bacterium]